MIKEANDYTVLSAGSDFSGGDAEVLTDLDLGLILGGNPSQVQGPDLRSASESYPQPTPQSAAEQFLNFHINRVLNDASNLLRIPIITNVIFPPRPVA